MTSNRLIGGHGQGTNEPVTEDRIRDYCVTLNQTNWVRASGQPYRTKHVELNGQRRLTLERYFPTKDELRALRWSA